MRETREIAAVEIITSDCVCVCVNKDNQVERMRDIIYIYIIIFKCVLCVLFAGFMEIW